MSPDFSSYLKPYFNLTTDFPAGYPGPHLPGAAVTSAISETGTIVIQEIKLGKLIIEHSSYYFLRKIKIPFLPDMILLNTALAIKNSFLLKGNGIQNILLKQGQYIFFHPAGKPYEFIFEKKKDYQLFNVRYPEEAIHEITPVFPELLDSFHTRTREGKPFTFTSPTKTPSEATKIRKEIINCKHEGKAKEYLFDKKVKESLCVLLINQDIKIKKLSGPNAEETEKLNAIADLLLNHIHTHYPVPQLARRFQMNETKLQFLFRKFFGKTIYSYQRDRKLETAHKLIAEENRSVKYAALTVGYKNVNAFETEFKKYFGYTPGSLLRKK